MSQILLPSTDVNDTEIPAVHRALLEGLDTHKCLILQLRLACPAKYCHEKGRNIPACRNYVLGHHCSKALRVDRESVEEGMDTVPLTMLYNWECVRDCPWKGINNNARLLARYAAYLSKFRVCQHSLSVATRWAMSEGRLRPAAPKPRPADTPVAPDLCEAELGKTNLHHSKKLRKPSVVNGKRIQIPFHKTTQQAVTGIDGPKWLCYDCTKNVKRVDKPVLQAMFGSTVRFCGPTSVL
jgi:hypothetical protein